MVLMINVPKLNPPEFLSWHDNFTASAIIGSAHERNYCPLAHYLGDNWVVDITSYHFKCPYGTTPLKYFTLPIWAQNYRYLIDQVPYGTEITAEFSKKALEHALEHKDQWTFPEPLQEIKPKPHATPLQDKEIEI